MTRIAIPVEVVAHEIVEAARTFEVITSTKTAIVSVNPEGDWFINGEGVGKKVRRMAYWEVQSGEVKVSFGKLLPPIT